MVNNEFELLIRRGYSAISPNLETLSLWISNTLSELCEHDDMIYDFKIRHKTVESLIGKVDRLLSQGHTFETFTDVTAAISDLVGARVIVYVPSELVSLHASLMAFTRLKVYNTLIHHHEEVSRSLIDRVSEISPFAPHLEENQTGYFGIHYVLEPVFYDEFYQRTKIAPFNKFELQLRTLLNHAWCEMQHRLIYKSRLGTSSETRAELFTNLSLHINTCDKVLDRLCHPLTLSPTFPLPHTTRSIEYKSLLDTIQSYISDFESSPKTTMGDRYNKVKEFISNNKEQLNILSSKVSKDNIDFNVELAEMYLKSGHYKLAYDLYHKCSKHTDEDGKIWLRLAETCSGIGTQEKEAEAIDYIKKLAQTAQSRQGEVKLKDDYLFASGSLIAWQYKHKEEALYLGEMAVKSTKEGYCKEGVRTRVNLIYYKLDYTREKYLNDISQLDQCVNELKPIVQYVTDKKSKEYLIAHNYDTLAWYY